MACISKFTPEQVRQIRERFAAGETLRVLAQEHGLTKQAVSLIAHGAVQRGAGGPITRRPEQGVKKLTAANVVALRERAAAGEKQIDLAKEFRISQNTVSGITTGLSYRFVGGPRVRRRVPIPE